jgi:outer membrane protein OmpA-like peptidoglycan-associated protein
MKTPFMAVILMAVCSLSLSAQTTGKITSKYDFVPGEKIVFYDDFTSENVGDFPAAWNTSGSGEIVTTENFPGRWLQLTKGGFFIPEAKAAFSENFTIEFDFVPMLKSESEGMYGVDFFVLSGTLSNPSEGGAVPGKAGLKMTIGYDNVSWSNYSIKDAGYVDNGSSPFQFKPGQKYHVAFWIQKQRVRMYVNENKVLDAPRAFLAGYVYNIFRIETSDEAQPMLARFRIATGLPDLRNKLLTTGKYISYGIQFDVNSDELKPESEGTLREIAQVLKDNPTLRIKIVGHTDSDGDNSSNLDLSKLRASSVKNALNTTYGIDNKRMETDGKGETQPLAPNDNSINKAKNRRVEFIKI